MRISKKYQLIHNIEITQEVDYTEEELEEFLLWSFCQCYCNPNNPLAKHESEGNEVMIGESVTWKKI